MAQDALRHLDKDETARLVVGKKVEFRRSTDNTVVAWDFRDDDKVYYAPPGTHRSIVVAGTYRIGEDGRVCFKWNNQDRYVTMTDGCSYFRREDGKLKIVGFSDPDRVRGEVVE